MSRSVDACAPFVVWASSDDAGYVLCDHGAWVDTRFETLDLERRTLVSTVRAAERADDDSVYATTDRVNLTCRLDTGQCTANDADAAAFLAQHTWFERQLQSHMTLVRGRADRAARQRDRETSARHALANAEPGKMIAFDGLFPADWDLLVTHEGAHYWGVDQYCANPACDCAQLAVTLYHLRAGAPVIGRARLDLALQRPTIETSSPIAADVFKAFWAEHEAALRARRTEARNAIVRFAPQSAKPAPAAALPPSGSRTPRNAPCPCGSGKKYKRCCLGARVGESEDGIVGLGLSRS
jgi:uncharacterized protein YchJ